MRTKIIGEGWSKERLIKELKELNRQIAELEKPESWRNHAEGVLRRVSEELEMAKSNHAHLLANISDAIIATDERFNITYWNPPAETFFGWKADEVLNHPMHEVLRSEFISTGHRIEAVRMLMRTGRVKEEMIQYNRDGKPIHVERLP